MSKTELIVTSPTAGEGQGGFHRISASLRGAGIEREIWFRSRTPFAKDSPLNSAAFLAAGLFAAMRLRCPLRVEAPVPADLLRGIHRYQQVNSWWHPELSPVEIIAEEAAENTPAGGRRGSGAAWFFTAGVDSFYTYLALREKLSHAVFLHGADIGLHEVKRRRSASALLREASAAMGVQLLEVETNMVQFTDRYCEWGQHFHGAGLITTAMLFSNHFRKLAIASSDPLYRAPAWGSHPVTDPLWSTDGFEIAHHGAGWNRLEKIGAVARSELAMRYLRVCWRGAAGRENCCECEKCLRTMVGLRLHGVLENSPTFRKQLDLRRVGELRFGTESNRDEWWWNLQASRHVDDPQLTQALERLTEVNHCAEGVREFARHGKGMLASPEWARLLPKVRNKLFRSLRDSDADWFSKQVVRNAGDLREEVFDMLWRRHRKWLKRKLKTAERGRVASRLRSAIRRLRSGGRRLRGRRGSANTPRALGSPGHLLEPAAPRDR